MDIALWMADELFDHSPLSKLLNMMLKQVIKNEYLHLETVLTEKRNIAKRFAIVVIMTNVIISINAANMFGFSNLNIHENILRLADIRCRIGTIGLNASGMEDDSRVEITTSQKIFS